MVGVRVGDEWAGFWWILQSPDRGEGKDSSDGMARE